MAKTIAMDLLLPKTCERFTYLKNISIKWKASLFEIQCATGIPSSNSSETNNDYGLYGPLQERYGRLQE